MHLHANWKAITHLIEGSMQHGLLTSASCVYVFPNCADDNALKRTTVTLHYSWQLEAMPQVFCKALNYVYPSNHLLPNMHHALQTSIKLALLLYISKTSHPTFCFQTCSGFTGRYAHVACHLVLAPPTAHKLQFQYQETRVLYTAQTETSFEVETTS